MKKAYQRWVLLGVALLLASLCLTPTTPRALAQSADPPQTLVFNAIVGDWTVASPRLIWLNNPVCDTPPPGPSLQAAGDPVTLNRIRTTGSDTRTLYLRNDPRAPDVCNPYKPNSNIVADKNFIYWVEDRQLVRLSVSANIGDAPQPWGPSFGGGPVELAITDERVVTLERRDCQFCLLGTAFELVSKADGSSISHFARFEFGNNPAYDGTYLYFKDANSALRRVVPGSNADPITIAQQVSDYVAEGETTLCNPAPGQINCTTTSYVFYIQNVGTNSIVRFNNRDGGYQLIYLPNPPGGQVGRLRGLALERRSFLPSLGQSLFFFEQRFVPCPTPPGCFTQETTELLRVTGRGGGSPDDLYIRQARTDTPAIKLRGDGTNLFWQETTGAAPNLPSTIKRLPANAAALPKINLVATGLEITQGVQKSDNSVPLLQDRRTFVRFFARSVGQNVPGVGASLQLSASGLPTIAIGASNPIGSRLTLVPSPTKGDLNQSFLFELPAEYLRASDLRLRATVNPFGVPLEPTLNDNVATAGPFAFQTSPRLIVNMVSFSYTFNGTNYSVNELSDIARATSLIRRMFPLASTPGYFSTEPGEIGLRGLRPLLRTIVDDEIAKRIDYTTAAKNASQACKYLIAHEADGTTVKTDDRNRCATEYVLGRLQALRNEKKLPNNPTYGFIPSPSTMTPRGWAVGDRLAAGNAGGADTAAHELGHMLGRNHPFKGSADDTNACGNGKADGAYDNSYPYKDSLIGPGDGSISGLDSGTSTFLGSNAPMRLYTDTNVYDIMGYCGPNRWISDYTYRCMLNFMNNGTTAKECGGASLLRVPQPQQAGGTGDWLNVVGVIGASGQAELLYVRRVNDVADTPVPQGSAYRLQLLDGSGTQLADYPFTPEAGDDGPSLSFALVVPFVAGTREVRLVAAGGGPATLLARKAISGNAPTVSSVALQNPPNPVAGTVTLGWNASDADGDALTFDVLWSRDNGASFQPIRLSLTGTSLAIDTTALGGGPTIFQVVASDGAQSGQANSAPVTIAPSPPRPRILNPGDGARFEWGQWVNFSGEAADPQDGSLSGAKLVWSDRRGVRGTGAVLSTRDLLVGTNAITLTATNSAGLTASAVDLTDPGPTFSVAPSLIGWNVAPGTTQGQTAVLGINNAGGGTLNWAASSDAPWLTLSASSGDAPASITLTANPSGFADGQSVSATITLTSSTPGVQPVRVPVTLSIGNAFSRPLPPGASAAQDVRLPVVAR
jgi:hypothetical protein